LLQKFTHWKSLRTIHFVADDAADLTSPKNVEVLNAAKDVLRHTPLEKWVSRCLKIRFEDGESIVIAVDVAD
jgi:hypothetical protein